MDTGHYKFVAAVLNATILGFVLVMIRGVVVLYNAIYG